MLNLLFLITLMWMVVSCNDAPKNLQSYQFDETKRLVVFVEDAAALVRAKGTAAFADFAEKEQQMAEWQPLPVYI